MAEPALAWNYGDILERVAALVPDRPALVHGDRVLSWADVDKRSNALARSMLGAGEVATGDKVAFYLRNHSAYLEGCVAAFKARLVHVNVNYRYTDDELFYLLDDSDAAVVIYGAEFAGHVDALRERLPKVKRYIEVSEQPVAAQPVNAYALDYESACTSGDEELAPLEIARSADDLLFIYTGGTTGMPKGVMWRHEDRLRVYAASGAGAEMTAADFAARAGRGNAPVVMPCCPLMHSTGLTTALNALLRGGCVVTLTEASFDPSAVWQAVERWRISSLAIVGDAIGQPLLATLNANPSRWNLSSMTSISSAGVMWSDATKQGLLEHLPQATLWDTFGSSEGSGLGSSRTTVDGSETRGSGSFKVGAGCKVFSEDHREIEPGSGEAGLIAKSGAIPVGYYKDPERSARTFPTIGGVRYSIPGDWCLVDEDGTIRLLGRGSGCINTGGEKVYAEEVEEALKRHEAVRDALVFGVPDPRWGQAVVAVLQPEPEGGKDDFDVDAVLEGARAHVADYKIPKRVVTTVEEMRFANGKPNYAAARDIFAALDSSSAALVHQDQQDRSYQTS